MGGGSVDILGCTAYSDLRGAGAKANIVYLVPSDGSHGGTGRVPSVLSFISGVGEE
jgi:hypothetical protein